MGSVVVLAGACLGACVGYDDSEGLDGEPMAPIEGIEDIGGGEPSGSQQVFGPELVINEIMYNPAAVRDEDGEWLELYNASGETVDLIGWSLRDYGSNRHVIDESIVVEPGQYVVLGRSCDVERNGGYVPDYCYGDEFKLANDPGDGIELRDADNAYVDSVSYDTRAPWPTNTPGASIALSDPGADNREPGAWSLARGSYGVGDLGSPGLPNPR
jgi:hypothetical protein